MQAIEPPADVHLERPARTDRASRRRNTGDRRAVDEFWLRAEPSDSRIRGLITTGGNTAAVATTKAYNDNTWHHIALQRKAGSLSLGVDGAQVASVAAPTGSVSPGRPFKMYVGQRLDGLHHFDGSLDEVRIYKRALTAAEISSIRTSNATGIPNEVLDLPLG